MEISHLQNYEIIEILLTSQYLLLYAHEELSIYNLSGGVLSITIL